MIPTLFRPGYKLDSNRHNSTYNMISLIEQSQNIPLLLSPLLLVAFFFFFFFFSATLLWNNRDEPKKEREPVSVNYHFTRKCNYSCGFCFHTAKSSFVLSLDEAKKGLLLLKESGMRKLNLAGGEPLLRTYHEFVGELIRYAKEDLQLESLSIVSNGSQLSEAWFEQYGKHIDILAISCDSFHEEVNKRIGRGAGNHIRNLLKAKDLCQKHHIKFKINTVVNMYNWEEDMNERITELQPSRWKCFQVLKIEGENAGQQGEARDVTPFLISSDQWEAFCKRHQHQASFVPESNEAMKDTYLLMDEHMRFLNCTKNRKDPTESILKVGVKEALQQSGWDDEGFLSRGGVYSWTKASIEPTGCGSLPKELEW